jgi:hypothetical protein
MRAPQWEQLSQHTGIRGVPHSVPLHAGHGSRPVPCTFFFAMTSPQQVCRLNALAPNAAPAVVISAPTLA